MRYRLAGLFCLALLAGATVWAFRSAEYPAPASYIKNGQVQISAATEHWKQLIETKGPQAAHDAMVAEAINTGEGTQHTLSHTFGSALYEAGGPAYAPYCGLEFLYGCYHQFFGLAISEFGLPVMKSLQTPCATAPVNEGSCAHGAGHAILSTYGYTPDAFAKTAKDCTALYDKPWDRVFCVGGATMEYNFREVLEGDKRSMRPFVEATAFEPCLSAAPEFQKECLYQLPPWWYSSLASTPIERSEVYKKLGVMCREFAGLTHAELIPACFAGIGMSVAGDEYFKPAGIAGACDLAGATSNERLYCLSHAAQRFYLEKVPQKENVCVALGLIGADESFCEKYMSTPRDKAFELPSPYSAQ
jgi:hypothetical protein